MIFVLA